MCDPENGWMSQTMAEDERRRSNNNVKKSYRRILEDIDQNVIEDVEQSQWEGAFDDAARKAGELYETVVTPSDALLDLQVLHRLSLLCRKRAETLSTNERVFRADEFVDRLVEEVGGVSRADGGGAAHIRMDQWVALGQGVRTLFARPPPLQYMLGAIEVEEVEKKKKPQRRAPKVVYGFIHHFSIIYP